MQQVEENDEKNLNFLKIIDKILYSAFLYLKRVRKEEREGKKKRDLKFKGNEVIWLRFYLLFENPY